VKKKRRKTGQALCLNAAFFGYYAHAGFVDGLESIGFAPDAVTGSSAGALVGALYSAGVEMNETLRLMSALRKKDFWEGNFATHLLKPFLRGWKNYTGLLSGSRIRKLLEPYLGGLQFEDLKTRLGIAVSNITRGERELRTSGSVLESVMCSMAFPILMEIQPMDGHHFLDGGVVDAEPIKELILDPEIKKIVIHSIETVREEEVKSPLIRAFHSSVSIIERETRDLKEIIAKERRKKIIRLVTITPALGPDRTHLGKNAIEAGRATALANRKRILG